MCSRSVVARTWRSLGIEGENKGYIKKGKDYIKVMEIFFTLIVGMISQLYTVIKTHQILLLKLIVPVYI